MRRLRLPSWVVVALMLSVPLGLALVLPAPSSDTRELLSWGLHPSLTTPKQPPLMQWMGFVVMRLAWPTTFWCVALTQALNAVGLTYAYLTLRLWTAREQAAVFVVLLAGAVCFIGAPVAFALNADIIQFPFWAGILFHGVRAVETRRSAHWLAMTAALSLAFYAKYTVVVLAASMALASFTVRSFRDVWRDARLYLSAAGVALLVAPHLLAASQSGALAHATGTLFVRGGIGWRLKNLRELFAGFFAYLAPAWTWLLLALIRDEAELVPDPRQTPQFVRATCVAALGLLLCLVAGLGFKYPSRYDSPFLFIAWLSAASCLRFDPDHWPAASRWMMKAAICVAAAVLVGGGIVYGALTVHPRQQEPLLQAAAELEAEWRSRYACGPAYVMGDLWSAYGLGISMRPPLPGVHLSEMNGAPGYDPLLREREGAILVYHDRIKEVEAHALWPDIDLSKAERLTLPFARTLDRKPAITYVYLFIPPRGC